MNDFFNLPDYMTSEETIPYVQLLMSGKLALSQKEILIRLYELSQHRDDVTEPLGSNIEQWINEFLMLSIDYESIEVMSLVMGMVPGFNLKEIYETIQNMLPEIQNQEVVELVKQYHRQFLQSASDSYAGFWRDLKP